MVNLTKPDVYRLPIGIRTLAWTNTSLLLNDRPVYMRGFGRHEDSAIRGRGFDLVTAVRDHDLLQWVGANAYRTSHYPYSDEVLDIADRYREFSSFKIIWYAKTFHLSLFLYLLYFILFNFILKIGFPHNQRVSFRRYGELFAVITHASQGFTVGAHSQGQEPTLRNHVVLSQRTEDPVVPGRRVLQTDRSSHKSNRSYQTSYYCPGSWSASNYKYIRIRKNNNNNIKKMDSIIHFELY